MNDAVVLLVVLAKGSASEGQLCSEVPTSRKNHFICGGAFDPIVTHQLSPEFCYLSPLCVQNVKITIVGAEFDGNAFRDDARSGIPDFVDICSHCVAPLIRMSSFEGHVASARQAVA
jgi:hypothetical protein